MTAPLITILDDEPQIRSMLATALEDAGFRTASFGRATEFEAALATMKPDICLVDLGLPDKDGKDKKRRIGRHKKSEETGESKREES